ncbi:MAG: hypothetical protein M1836_006955 [Candelina mexicana]|nr:MAG: hypothetical protein M1836_006955 [Candelina mexicana]
MNQAPQPDFAQLSQCVNGVAREVSRLENVPAFNQGQIIIAQLQAITRALEGLGAQLNANETNSVARLHNSTLTSSNIPLYPLRDRRNQPVNGFPEDGMALMQLSGVDLTNLLRAYDQPDGGNVATKRKRFRQFIGIMTDI